MPPKRSVLLKIYLTPEEHRILQGRATAAALSLSRYGRLALLSPFRRDLHYSQNLKDRYEALTLHLGQHYSLLSLMVSDLHHLNQQAVCLKDSSLRKLLSSVQMQVNSTRDELEALAQQLRNQEEA